ncbi:uncharacterized protein BCR38DRAFT_459513 [Pseudomassariella vexata]|uniref:Glycoside hydrolase 131 catalytic N-terminal domain-containing protein n=1 Tax=Pseudomassariella vexata TaxID=1141098 RepID=A0A1Y2DQY4_9PEZI|nr:uncharacterized protein BCR38DRAFT_459513 [Pseudomassariella vexata]ORY61703.1 hypothetical protein BCR38DRAFT_459513 [Pseudomassariella vexata]
MKFSSTLPFAAGVSAGTVLWDGRFNSYASSADLTEWSWSNQVGEYQYYIHGSGEVTEYVNLSEDYKNPADTASDQGVKISLTDTAYWNGQTMRRTELIPQTTAAIGAGKVYYHFSMKRSDVNPPAETREHQIAFFESHFTEMKAGWMSGASGTSDASLRWFANSQSQWNVTWEADVWHNVAYEIDFDAGTVGFWHSTGADALTQVVAPVTASTSSNGADWHLGVLELPRDGYTDAVEDIYFSGVYVESGDLTTEIGSGSGSSSGSSSIAAAPAATSVAATSAQASTVASPTTLQTSTVAASIATSAASSPATSASTSAVTTASIHQYEELVGSGQTAPRQSSC